MGSSGALLSCIAAGLSFATDSKTPEQYDAGIEIWDVRFRRKRQCGGLAFASLRIFTTCPERQKWNVILLGHADFPH